MVGPDTGLPIVLAGLAALAVGPASAAVHFGPPVSEADFGPADTWRGFLADGSRVRYATDYEGWSRTIPGGLELDPDLTYEGEPTGRLLSLGKGYLAFRPIRVQREWDFIEFALHNTVPGDGVVQFRVYYGLEGPEEFWGFRHGFFYHAIQLDFAGWRAFRLRRSDFGEYGTRIGWLDEQLQGLALHVTTPPSQLTEVHLAGPHLTQSPVTVSVARDLLRTNGAPVTFGLTVGNSGDTPRRLDVSIVEEPFAYSSHPSPFEAIASQGTVAVPPGQDVGLTLAATPRAEAAPGDAVTFVVQVADPSDPVALASVRLHAVMERPRPALHRLDELGARADKEAAEYGDRPPLSDAAGVLYWTEGAARAYVAGNLTAGQKLADVLRELGDPERGYPALCVQPYNPYEGNPDHEPRFEKVKAWYQGFHWAGPIAVARAYDLIYDSGLLSDADKERVEDNLLRPLARLAMLNLNSCSQDNPMASILAVGLSVQDPDLITRAIDGPLGFTHHIGHDMLDGINIEGTLSYMWWLTWPILARAADMASCSGIDLFHKPCPVDTDRNHLYHEDVECPSHNSIWQHDTEPGERTRTLMDALFGMADAAYPDWRLPAIHDTSEYMRLPIPPELYRNPLCRDEVLAVLGDTDLLDGGRLVLPQRLGALKRPSRNLSAIGWAVLRANDGNRLEDQYLLMDYGPHGGFHGACDKLQLIYWRHGKELAPDLPICDLMPPDAAVWSGYFHQSVSHNTIVLDGQSQLPSTGEACLTFAPLSGAQVVELEGVAAYVAQQARVRRLAFMARDYVLVIDRVASVLPHTIDFVLHGAGQDATLSTTVPLVERDGPLGERDGYEYITLSGEGSAAGPYEANWGMGDGVGLRLISLGGDATQVLVGRGPAGYRRGGAVDTFWPEWYGPKELLPDGVLVARRQAAAGVTRFVTLLEGHKDGSRIVSAELDGSAVRVVLSDGAIETLRWSGGDYPGEPTSCEFRREEAGRLAQVALVHGQAVAEGERGLLRCERPMAGCSVEYRGDEAHVWATDACTVEFLPPAPVSRVIANGQEVTMTVGAEGTVRADVPRPGTRQTGGRR